jgi:hypothetical protein
MVLAFVGDSTIISFMVLLLHCYIVKLFYGPIALFGNVTM